ncbi:MAG: ABC transporter substrate-binding protein [Pseudomonadota bacterium]
MTRSFSPNRTRRGLLALAGAAVFMAGSSLSPVAADSMVQIGVMAPLTGPASADGEDFVRGVTMAVEEANAAGGIDGYTFEVVPADVRDGSAGNVTSAVERLLGEQNLHVVLTGYASITNFEIDLMADADMPFMIAGPAGQTRAIIQKDPERYWCCWSLTPSFDRYDTGVPPFIEALGARGELDLKDRKVAIVSSDNAYSKTISEGMKKTFAEAGWTITVDELVPFGEVNDWRTILAKVRQDPPAVVINTDYLPGNSASFLNQFLEDPTDSLVFLQYAPSVPEFLELTGENANGVIYNLLGGIIESPAVPRAGELLAKFKDRFGVESGYYGVGLYEMTWVYFDALAKVGDPTNYRAVGKAIGETDKPAAQGRIKFDPTTHLAVQDDDHMPLLFYQLWDGKRVLLSPLTYATGEFRLPPWMSK